LERNAVAVANYRMSSAVTGPGQFKIYWTDVLGRVVEDRAIPGRQFYCRSRHRARKTA